MSRTDNTRPGWLVEYADGRLHHDHRSGTCVPATFSDIRRDAGGRSSWHSRYDCARWEYTIIDCPGHPDCWHARAELADRIRLARACGDDDRLAGLHRYGPGRPYRCRDGHAHWAETGLDCGRCTEQAAQRAITCRYWLDADYLRVQVVHGSRASEPGDRRRAEGRARTRTRDVLRAAAAEWNAYGDTDVEPEPTRHRHSCAWW